SFGSAAVWAGAGVGLPGIGVAAGALGSLVACAIFIVAWPSAQTQMSADAVSIITAQRIVRIFFLLTETSNQPILTSGCQRKQQSFSFQLRRWARFTAPCRIHDAWSSRHVRPCCRCNPPTPPAAPWRPPARA